VAHFAEIDENNVVLRVVVVADEHEPDGANWCVEFFGGGIWVQTSYNDTIRNNFAGIGYVYDPDLDAFISPQPYPSWALNQESARWEPPTPMPEDGFYVWDEAAHVWIDGSTA